MQKKWKRLTALALAAGMCFGNVVTTLAAQTPGWKQNAAGWWYENAGGGYVANDWSFINGKWYHFDASGYMQTGWLQTPDGLWYYLDRANGDMKIGWAQDVDGKWYYLNDNGAMATGWVLDKDGRWYYTNQSGVMQTGWLKNADGKWYYMNQSGAMVTGWVKDSTGKYYYLNNSGAWDPNYDDSSSSSSSSSSSGSHSSSNIVTGNDYTYDKKMKVLTITENIGTAESYVNINNLDRVGTIDKLVIKEGVENVYIEGTTVGDVDVLGGGSNSVHFRGLTVRGTMSVKNKEKKVHIVLERKTVINQVTVLNSSTIEVEEEATIKSADIQASATMSGAGKVTAVKVNTNEDVTFDVLINEMTIVKEAQVVIKKKVEKVKVTGVNVTITVIEAIVGTIETDTKVNVDLVGKGQVENTEGKGEVATNTAYRIEISSEGNGTVKTDPSTSAKEGTKVVITATANAGYKVGEIKVTANNAVVEVNAEDNSFIMPAADVTITVTFVEEGTVTPPDVDTVYTVAVPTSVSNAAITADKTEAKEGELVTVKVKPENGYVVNTATYTTASGTQNMTAKTANAEYTFIMPSEDVTAITVTVKEAPVTPEPGGDQPSITTTVEVKTVTGGGVNVKGDTITVVTGSATSLVTPQNHVTATVNSDNTVKVVLNSAPAGYNLANAVVVVDGKVVELSNNTWTSNAVYTKNITITVYFADKVNKNQ